MRKKDWITLSYGEVLLLEELIVFLPNVNSLEPLYEWSYRKKKAVLESIINGGGVALQLADYKLSLLMEQTQSSTPELSGLLKKLQTVFAYMWNFISGKLAKENPVVTVEKAKQEFVSTITKLVQVNPSEKLGMIQILKSDKAKSVFNELFNKIWGSLTNILKRFYNSENYQKYKSFVESIKSQIPKDVKDVNKYIAEKVKEAGLKIDKKAALFGRLYEWVTSENVLKSLSAKLGILGAAIGLLFLLLHLLGKIPVVGKLFRLVLKVLTFPLRIIWKVVFFVARKLKIVT